MSKLKLLYVEDEPDIQKIAKMTMESVGGYHVVACSSGTEALEVIKTFTPDMILLDVMMPEMNGPETMKKLRKIPSMQKIPVVFMTAKVQAREINEYLALGALGVIPKPFDPMQVCEEIERFWMMHKKQIIKAVS